MKGHIRPQGKNSWGVIIYLGRDPVTRKPKYQSHTVHGTKKDAEAKLAELLHKLNTGEYARPGKMTFGEFLDRWLNDCETSVVRPSTLKRHTETVQLHLKPALGNIALAKLSPLHLQHYYTQKLASGLSPGTVRRHHAVIHKALEQAVRWGLIARNIADLVEPPRAERQEMQTLTIEQVARLLEASRPTGRYALYLMAVATGLREGEILGLRWSDVDLERGIITVQQSLKRAGEEVQFAPVKTSKSIRQVVMPESLIQALKSHKAKQAEERLFYGPAYRDYNLVFTVAGGGPISPRNLIRQFKSLLRKAGLPDIRFHDLRHTHATLLLAQGIHPKIVSERLGHSAINVTMDIYSHVIPSLQQEAAAKLDEQLFKNNEKSQPI